MKCLPTTVLTSFVFSSYLVLVSEALPPPESCEFLTMRVLGCSGEKQTLNTKGLKF